MVLMLVYHIYAPFLLLGYPAVVPLLHVSVMFAHSVLEWVAVLSRILDLVFDHAVVSVWMLLVLD